MVAKRFPNLDWSCAEEFTLASMTLAFLEQIPTFSGTVGYLAEKGDPVGRWCARNQETISSIFDGVGLVEEFGLANIEPHRLLMELTARTKGQKPTGVYYTPVAVARMIVRTAIDHLEPYQTFDKDFRLLEPACGTGVFLDQVVQELKFRGHSNKTIGQIMGRSACIDLSPSALVVFQYLLLARYRMLEFDVREIQLPRTACGNALTGEIHKVHSRIGCQPNPGLQQLLQSELYHMVIGNPPFGTLSAPTGKWMHELLHGKQGSGPGAASYFRLDGVSVVGRKTWLHDQYVQFLRLAQWHAERTPRSAIGLVLNSGFLQNLTFRAVRYHLFHSFQHLDIVDLGGDLRNQRHLSDQNVFPIETGIATVVASRTPGMDQGPKAKPIRMLTRLVGQRQAKLAWCDNRQNGKHFPDLTISTQPITCPKPPDYRLFATPVVKSESRWFRNGRDLDRIFIKKWSVPVTARDHLVIDWTKDRLIRKIEKFLEPDATDDEIRQHFFPLPRSNRYPRGNTRGWQLETVRPRLRELNWKEWIIDCSYRPFDTRTILWHPTMIDWPRGDLASQMVSGKNPCLITRRQSPPVERYSYFWITRHIPIDGIIRNDNRGNEYCFPMLVDQGDGLETNICEDAIKSLRNKWGTERVDGCLIFWLVVCQVHSSAYQTWFTEELTSSYPRIFWPRQREFADRMVDLGKSLIELMSARPPNPTESSNIQSAESDRPIKGRPAIKDNRLIVSPDIVAQVRNENWDLKIGSHQVMKKYLQNRIRSGFTQNLVRDLEFLDHRIQNYRELVRKIDDFIESLGGFNQVFDMEEASER